MEVFEYIGNGQRVPEDVVSMRFHPSVTKVENMSVKGRRNLKKIVFNEGIKTIGHATFSCCKSLLDFKLPSTLTSIRGFAFECCDGLTKVVFNEGLKRMAGGTFQGCRYLESITLPSSLAVVPCTTFKCCFSLKEVVFVEGIKKIYEGAFQGCTSLESITLPSTLDMIGGNAFFGCSSLRKVSMNEKNLETIYDSAFAYCPLLERFDFPSISSRLEIIIQTEYYPRVVTKVDEISGEVIQRSSSELYVTAEAMGAMVERERESHELFFSPPIREARESNWNAVRQRLRKISAVITYYEMTEATSLFELALWKAKIDQGEENSDRDACRIDVPGPIKDTILQYLGSTKDEDANGEDIDSEVSISDDDSYWSR